MRNHRGAHSMTYVWKVSLKRPVTVRLLSPDPYSLLRYAFSAPGRARISTRVACCGALARLPAKSSR
jgi:hypothetical protein